MSTPRRPGPSHEDEGITLTAQSEEQRKRQQQKAAEVAAQFDSESRVRTTAWKPLMWLISGVAIFTALYHMYTAYFGTPPTLIHRSIHVSLILFLVFVLYPPTRRAQGLVFRIIDAVLALLALVPTWYLMSNYEQVVLQAGRFTETDIMVSTLLVVLVLEAARRVTGWALPILALQIGRAHV